MKTDILKNITLINADCMNVMRTMPDNAFDLAIVDPPYGININHSIGRRKGQKRSNYKVCYWDNSIPEDYYFEELFRVSTNQIVWGGNYMTKNLAPSRCWVIWDKMFSENVSFSQYEMAWTSFSSSAKKFTLSPSNIINRIHPTQKPVELYKWLLANYASPGDKILDTHLGSGSICIACDDLGFDMTGIELDPDYYNAAKKRIICHQAQQKLF